MSTRDFSIANDTLNGAVAISKLTNEINENQVIIYGLASMVESGDNLKVSFKYALTTEMWNEVLSILAAHDGVPVKEEQVQKYEEKLPQGGKKVTYRGFYFAAAANQVTTHDHKFTEDLYLRDGDFEVKDHHFNDTAYMALVDIDYLFAGILYPIEPAPGVTWDQAMPNGVTLHEYIKDYPLEGEVSIASTPIPNAAITDLNVKGLTMRVKYNNNNPSTPVCCKCRLRSYS